MGYLTWRGEDKHYGGVRTLSRHKMASGSKLIEVPNFIDIFVAFTFVKTVLKAQMDPMNSFSKYQDCRK